MKRGKPSITSLMAFGLILGMLVVTYVLSHAPVYSILYGDEPADERTTRRSIKFYSPVEGLIDGSPLRNPLLNWADVWGVGVHMRMDSSMRWAEESTPPPPVSNPGPHHPIELPDDYVPHEDAPQTTEPQF